MRGLLEAHIVEFADIDVSNVRPSHAVRRACSLALARHLLIENQLLPITSANETTIQHEESGKPYLKFPKGSHPDLQISISHSGQWCACLIAEGKQSVGLDLEDLHIPRSFLKLAEHYFSSEETECVRQYGKEAFYKLWTAKEAIAKQLGKGLSEVLKIKLIPTASDNNRVSFGSPGYRLSQHMTQDYIYTIAFRDFG